MEKEIMLYVKKKVREHSLTQKQVAKKLNVSLTTVKRWWRGQGVTLQVLRKLSSLVGLPLSELILASENLAFTRFTYNLEQERMLAQNPKALALYDLLISGIGLAAIKKKYQLSDELLTSLLLKLDRINLIELSANNKVKLLQVGEPQWIVNGPLSQKYRKSMINSLLGEHAKTEVAFLIYDYLPEDAIMIQSRIKDLEKLMAMCNVKSRENPEAVSCGAYITFKKFEWDLRTALKS